MFWQRWLYKEAPERLDLEGLSPRGLAIHADLECFNLRLGWTRRHLAAVALWWEALGRPVPFRVLDVGVGIGGFLEALCDWADARGIALEASGVDLQPGYVTHAQQRLGERAHVFVGDARDLQGEWDLGICTLTLHHVPVEQRAGVIAGLQSACRATYLFDLERTFYGWSLSPLFLRALGLGRDATADGTLSIRRACTRRQFQVLAAPLPGRVRRVFPTSLAVWPESTVE